MLIAQAIDALRPAEHIGADEIRLLDALDRCFLGWSIPLGAEHRRYRPVLPAAALERLGYFQDYPDEAVAADGALDDALILTPAACYDVYLSFRDRRLTGNHAVTVDAQIFRNPSAAHFEPLPWSYTQRKFVFVGDSAFVRDGLETAMTLMTEFATAIGLSVTRQAAPGTASQSRGSQLAKQLFAADQHFTAPPGLSIAQSNNHRTHYSSRLNIQLVDGGYAFAGCLGLLHDLWATALIHRYGSIETALEAVDDTNVNRGGFHDIR
jgi:hypothetical protein